MWKLIHRKQKKLNSLLDSNYKTESVKQKIEKYLIAILAEVGELINSTDYKWWKKTEPDIQNIQIEVVDILHFLQSIAITLEELNVIDLAFVDVIDSIIKDIFKDNKPSNCYQCIINLVDNLIALKNHVDSYVDAKNLQNANKNDILNQSINICRAYLLQTYIWFANLAYCYGLNYENLVKLYFAKNIVNKLRKEFKDKQERLDKNYLYDLQNKNDNANKELNTNTQHTQQNIDDNRLLMQHINELPNINSEDDLEKLETAIRKLFTNSV